MIMSAFRRSPEGLEWHTTAFIVIWGMIQSNKNFDALDDAHDDTHDDILEDVFEAGVYLRILFERFQTNIHNHVA